MALTHIGRGPKEKIATAIEKGTLVAGDMVITNSEKGNELVFIERDNSQVVIKSRTQEDIKVLGVDISDGVSEGAVISAGTDMDEFVKKLVQKRVAPDYVAPTIELTNNNSTEPVVVEVGTAVSMNIKSVFAANDAGALTSHVIKRDGVNTASGTNNTLTYAEQYTVKEGNNVFVSVAEYAEGAVKKDNFEEDSPANKIVAGTISSKEYVIVGARKMFYGTSTALPSDIDSVYIRALSNSKLAPEAGEQFTVTLAEGEQHMVVSLPSTRTLKSVKYLNIGDTDMLQKFVKSTVSVEAAVAGSADQSNVYVFSMAAPASANMHFELTLA